MSALVPYGHEEYAKARNVTRIKDEEVIKLNAELSRGWPSITKRKPALPDADDWKDRKDKLSELIR